MEAIGRAAPRFAPFFIWETVARVPGRCCRAMLGCRCAIRAGKSVQGGRYGRPARFCDHLRVDSLILLYDASTVLACCFPQRPYTIPFRLSRNGFPIRSGLRLSGGLCLFRGRRLSASLDCVPRLPPMRRLPLICASRLCAVASVCAATVVPAFLPTVHCDFRPCGGRSRVPLNCALRLYRGFGLPPVIPLPARHPPPARRRPPPFRRSRRCAAGRPPGR